MTDTYVIPLPYATPPLSANQGLHHLAKARLARQLRATARELAEEHGIPHMARCRVQLVWIVNSRHRRDSDNVVPTLKPLCDGLVDAGVVDDDTPAQMVKEMPVIAYFNRAVREQRLYLIVWELPEASQEALLARLEQQLGMAAAA